MLKNIRIVLVNTTHPGNIGAAARAMKTMGLTRLTLVAPEKYPSVEATVRASGADDLLAQAQIVGSLDEALAGCHLVFGASARQRTIAWPQVDARVCAALAVSASAHSTWASCPAEVAVVFGREQSGLTNDELERCHYLVHIPTNPDFPSLNIAAAVQVIAYEIRMASLQTQPVAGNGDDEHVPVASGILNPSLRSPATCTDALVSPPEAGRRERPTLVRPCTSWATADEMEQFYEHLWQTVIDIGFVDPAKPRLLARRLRRLFNRARLDKNEFNMLRGILAAAQANAIKH